eukprot:scaffold22.g6042.t1
MAEELKLKGNAAFKKGHRNQEAIEAWHAALAASAAAGGPAAASNLPALLHCNLAMAHLKLGNWAGALSEADQALDLQPGLAKALYRKAVALRELGCSAEAAAAAQQALLADETSAEARVLAAELQAQAAAAGPPRPLPVARGPRPPVTAAVLPEALAKDGFEYLPSPDGIDENLLILLHGLGDSPAPFAGLARRLALPQAAALALGGPGTVPLMGGRSWFEAFDSSFELIEGRPGELRRLRSLQATLAALQELLVRLEVQLGWQRRRVHLFGHAQGGTVALELIAACKGDRRLGSCVAAAPMALPEMAAAATGSNGPRDSSGRSAAAEPTPVLVVESMPRGKGDARQLMTFWASNLSRRPTAAELVASAGGGASGELLEVRPGEVTVELVEHG